MGGGDLPMALLLNVHPLKLLELSSGHQTKVMSERVLRTSGFYVLGSYQWPWWLLTIKMWLMWNYLWYTLFAENPFLFFSHTVWPGTGRSPTYLIQAATTFITSSLIPWDRWIQAVPNSFGEWSLTLSHGPFILSLVSSWPWENSSTYWAGTYLSGTFTHWSWSWVLDGVTASPPPMVLVILPWTSSGLSMSL